VPKIIPGFINCNMGLKLNGIFQKKDKYQTKHTTYLFCSDRQSAQILGTRAGYLDTNYPVSKGLGVEI